MLKLNIFSANFFFSPFFYSQICSHQFLYKCPQNQNKTPGDRHWSPWSCLYSFHSENNTVLWNGIEFYGNVHIFKYLTYFVNYYGLWTVILRENYPSARALVSPQPYGSRNQASGPPWPTRYIWPHSGGPRGGLIPAGENSRTYWFPTTWPF